MSERPTPRTAPLMHAAANESIEAMFKRGCDLERQLAERDAQLAEARTAMEWARQNLGKHTRPSPIDKALARIDAKGQTS